MSFNKVYQMVLVTSNVSLMLMTGETWKMVESCEDSLHHRISVRVIWHCRQGAKDGVNKA